MPTPDDKPQLEVDKLDLEVKHLKRSSWRTPAGLTACVAVALASVQWIHSKRELQLAEIKVVDAGIKLAQTEEKLEEIGTELDNLQEQRDSLKEDEESLRGQVDGLTKFIRDNPTLSGANALIEKMRVTHFPMSVSRSSGSSKSLKTVTAVTLAQNGKLKLNLAFTGIGRKFTVPGYTVSLTALDSQQPLKTFETGQLKVKGEQRGFFMVIRDKQSRDFTVPPEVMNQIHVSSQITVRPTPTGPKQQ